MREREEAKRARGELPEEQPKEKIPKRRGRKPKIDWASMSEEVNKESIPKQVSGSLFSKARECLFHSLIFCSSKKKY